MDRRSLFVLFLFGTVFFVVGLFVLSQSSLKRADEDKLGASGIHIQGVVQGKQAHRSSGTSSRNSLVTSVFYTIDVAYDVQGQTHYRSYDCTSGVFTSHSTGSGIEVVYDPRNPDDSLLANGNGQTATEYLWGGLLMTLVGPALIVGTLIYNKRSAASLAVNDDAEDRPHSVWSNDPLKDEDPGSIPVK